MCYRQPTGVVEISKAVFVPYAFDLSNTTELEVLRDRTLPATPSSPACDFIATETTQTETSTHSALQEIPTASEYHSQQITNTVWNRSESSTTNLHTMRNGPSLINLDSPPPRTVEEAAELLQEQRIASRLAEGNYYGPVQSQQQQHQKRFPSDVASTHSSSDSTFRCSTLQGKTHSVGSHEERHSVCASVRQQPPTNHAFGEHLFHVTSLLWPDKVCTAGCVQERHVVEKVLSSLQQNERLQSHGTQNVAVGDDDRDIERLAQMIAEL